MTLKADNHCKNAANDVNDVLQEHYVIAEGPLKAEDIRVMYGANYFSAGQIVLFRVDLGSYDEVYTNTIDGFFEKLSAALPSLYQHHCSEGKPGGFFIRIQTGTLLGHVCEHVAIELQTLAGMDVGYGKTRSTLKPGVYNVIFRFFDEYAGIYAGKAAINFINAILAGRNFDVREVIDNLIAIREARLLGPSTQAIVDEAKKRKIPYRRLDAYNLVQLGTGKYHKKIRATLTSDTNLIAVETAQDKFVSMLMLKESGIPVPETRLVQQEDEAVSFFREIGKPVAIKPRSGHLGAGIFLHLDTEAKIKNACRLAFSTDPDLLVQPVVQGNTYRVLVINYQVVAVTELEPPYIKGDGVSTIAMLVEQLNANPLRQVGDKGKLSRVEPDEATLMLMQFHGYSPESILPAEAVFFLKNTGNPKAGGFSRDVTDKLHPSNKELVEKVSRIIGLDVAGIDIIAATLSAPLAEGNGAVLEINAAPDFRMHMNPAEGAAQNVAVPFINMLFPDGKPCRIPVFSVTGTVGKTIFTHLLAYCLKREGYHVGMTSTEGLYIDGKRLLVGDMTYPEHVALVLKDPDIDCAVLETSREGILRRGLGYRFADVGVVLNIHDDHVGNDDIKYLEDLAYAKSVVAEEVYEEGFTILNADQEMVMEMRGRLYSKPVLFSRDESNVHVRKQIQQGGLVVFLRGKEIVVNHRCLESVLMNVDEIPLTFGDKALLAADSLLAVVCSLLARGIPQSHVQKYLAEFKPDPLSLPGRLNFFNSERFDILIDYAHNPVSLEGLHQFLRQLPGNKIGVLDMAGDRPDEMILKMGHLAVNVFDEVIFYEGVDTRGRTEGMIIELLVRGATENEIDKTKIHSFLTLEEALSVAVTKPQKGDLLVVLSARFDATLKLLQNLVKLTC
ncbi:MAG: cyanophycin synthetase [Bacteroidetes bacterium]|nr:cyanophycin synthetase [Bacteroidota bacterium]